MACTDPVAEYSRVLQEESERVCGTALPVELVRMILFRWGGMQTRSAALVRAELSVIRVAAFAGLFAEVRPGTRLSCNLRPPRVVGPRLANDYNTMPAPWLSFVYGALETQPGDLATLGHIDYKTDRVDSDARGMDLVTLLVYTGVPEYWEAAAECRGLSTGWMSPRLKRSFMPGYTRAGKHEMYRLLLRAETDPSWRFWVDLLWPRRMDADLHNPDFQPMYTMWAMLSVASMAWAWNHSETPMWFPWHLARSAAIPYISLCLVGLPE